MSKTIWVVQEEDHCYHMIRTAIVAAYPTEDRAEEVAEKLRQEALEFHLTNLSYDVVETKMEAEELHG